MNLKVKGIISWLSDFIADNKREFLCFSITFALGIVVGIIVTVSNCGGEFEKIRGAEIEYGAVKVFFFSALLIFIGYFVIAIAATNKKLNFIAVFPFPILGYFFGQYITLLVGCYGGVGIINLIFVYAPFFLCTFACMLFGACIAINLPPHCGSVRQSTITLLKFYGVNVLINFVIFLIIGAITKVIVVRSQ